MRSLLLSYLLFFNVSVAYKILVFVPRHSQSVNNFLGNIADTLVEAGHDVTTLIPIVNPLIRDGTFKSKKVYIKQNEATRKLMESINFSEADFFHYNDFNLLAGIGMGNALYTWMNAQCPAVLDEPGMVEKLTEENYDVMITESFEKCGIALSSIIKPKSLITTSGSVPFSWMFDEFGLDIALSYNPNMMISHLDVHSFWSRALNVYGEFAARLFWWTSSSQIDQLFKKRYGNSYTSVQEISSHAAATFINSEALVDFAAPTLNRVHYIGGIGAKEPKPLEKELDKLLSLRNRTVLLSFGSIVVSAELPLQVKHSIVEVISRLLDVTFLWKYEKPDDEFAKAAVASTPNLHILAWTPQSDLLADSRLTAFITHGGMASTQEVALRGKPGLFVPFMGDQPRNAGMMQKSGAGKVFHKLDLYFPDKFYAAVKDILENESYAQTAARIGRMIAKKPFAARDVVTRTVEFAAEFGPSPSLRPQSFDMNWIEYYNADVIVAFVCVLAVFLLVVFRSICALLRKVTRKMKLE